MNKIINQIDTAALAHIVQRITDDPQKGKIAFDVVTKWQGQFRTESYPSDITFGKEKIQRDFLIAADEPQALLGKDSAANPQELLLAALNACMSIGYVSLAAIKGITLSKLEIRTRGELDLRGFLGISPNVKAGYDSLEYDVTIAGDGSTDQFEEIHQQVMNLSPNRFNLSMPVALKANLYIDA